jgi:hypothetical protein
MSYGMAYLVCNLHYVIAMSAASQSTMRWVPPFTTMAEVVVCLPFLVVIVEQTLQQFGMKRADTEC